MAKGDGVADEVDVPDDAGEYAEALAAILRRFASGCVRWIECGPGWYPLIARLDAELFGDRARLSGGAGEESSAGLATTYPSRTTGPRSTGDRRPLRRTHRGRRGSVLLSLRAVRRRRRDSADSGW